MTLKIIEISGQIELIFDENSDEYKAALESFKEVINKKGNEAQMLKHVAYHVTRFGTDEMVEGVGYVGYNGRKPKEGPYSGIMVGEDYDEFDLLIYK